MSASQECITELRYQLLVQQAKTAKLNAMCKALDARLRRYEHQPPRDSKYEGPRLVVNNDVK